MATQIASTPTIKGEMALKIYNEANQKKSEKSKEGAILLMNKFKGKERLND